MSSSIINSIDVHMVSNDSIKTDVVYTGEFYTVARSEITIETNGKTRKIVAEGISRRSSRDIPNQNLGVIIAAGRAVEALKLKLKTKGNDFYKKKNGKRHKDIMKA